MVNYNKRNVKINYLLFISYNNDLKHNSIFETIHEVIEIVKEVISEENLTNEIDVLPIEEDLKTYLSENEDFILNLSNGTWFHIQCNPVFEKPN